jgi:hypothetical protein
LKENGKIPPTRIVYKRAKPYKLLQSKKLIRSTIFEEEKLENVHNTTRIKNRKDKRSASHQTQKSGIILGKWCLTTREEQSQLSKNQNMLIHQL